MVKKSRMFEFITDTYNPIGGKCPYSCSYCWASGLIKRFGYEKYKGKPVVYDDMIAKRFKPNSYVFVGSMRDIFADIVPDRMLLELYEMILENEDSMFLLMTKNPKRYVELLKYGIPAENIVFGVTIESNRNYPELSNAPLQKERMFWTEILSNLCRGYTNMNNQIFVSIEPILDFDIEPLVYFIKNSRIYSVAIGYDNYNNNLPEPDIEKTRELINRLKYITPYIYEKNMRE